MSRYIPNEEANTAAGPKSHTIFLAQMWWAEEGHYHGVSKTVTARNYDDLRLEVAKYRLAHQHEQFEVDAWSEEIVDGKVRDGRKSLNTYTREPSAPRVSDALAAMRQKGTA